jgi:hypothetical protein
MSTGNVTFQATLNNSANNFVVAWSLASTPLVVIGTIVPVKPYGNPWQVNIPSLSPDVVYIITLWESTSTSPSGTNRISANYEPTENQTTLRAPDYLTADITPGFTSGTSAYVNTTYAGWNYDLERVGQGTQFPQGFPNVTAPDYAQDTAGGFHLLNSGDVFAPGEKWVVRFEPQVSTSTASSTGTLTTGQIITANTTLDTTYLNQALLLQGASAALILTLPALSTVSDGQYLYFFSAGGSHIYATISAAGADKIQRKTQISQIFLTQNTILKLFRMFGVWMVDFVSPAVDMVGEFVYKSETGGNYQLLDGSLLSRLNYPGLYNYMNTAGVPQCSDTVWNTTIVVYDGVTYYSKKGFWTQGNGSTTFRIPDARGVFIRNADGTIRTFSSFQADAAQQHKHGTGVGLLPGAPFGKAPTASNRAKYGGPQSGFPDLTDLMYLDPGAGNLASLLQRVDNETRPANLGYPLLVRL